VKKGIFSRGTLLGIMVLALGTTSFSPVAHAVTYGSTVADPSVSTPWVVSIWNSPTNDMKDAEFRCSGTLISPHIVLTAAHCTLEPGAYFVKVKSQALNDQTPLTTVSGVWTSPRYDPKNFTNDIGLLRLDDDFPGITYPSLANAQAANSINTKTTFTLYGWGRDQSGNLADLLRSAKLSLQDAAAAKFFKSFFNSKTMISAGRKIVAENVWSGACPGDSGGPLIVSINQINVIAGVTSFGEKSCLTPNPTVFSRVSYYFTDIQNGLKSVELKSNVVNRSAPVVTVEPQITGNLGTNGSLICEPGQWKNSVSSSISWTSPKRLLGVTSPTVKVLTSDAGQVFSCTVIVSTKSGTILRKVLTKKSANAPLLTAQPAISGVDLSGPVTAGSTLRCDNWNWDGPVDSESIQWFLTAQTNPPAPVNGQLVGTGRTLSLDAGLITQLKGRYVTCDITGTRNGFSVDGITSIKLNPLDGPTITSVNVSGSSVALGSSLSCLFSTSQSATQIEITWGTSPDGINFTPFPGITGNVLQINKSVLQQGAGKIVACQVKVSNSAGQAQRIGVANSAFPTPPSTPVVTLNNPGTVTSNSYLSCSAQSGGGYYGQLAYQWGITSAANSTNFLGGPLSSSYSLSMNTTSFATAAGNYLTCVATATNDAGSTSGAASVYVAPVIMPLPTLGRPSSAGETAQSNTLTEAINIPSVSGFDPTKMSLSLSLLPSAGSCLNPTQITSTPTTINCSGLQPSTYYSAQLTVSYLSGGNGATQVSSILGFTTAAIQSTLYVCSTSCTGSLTNAQMNAEISDQRTIEAKSLGTVTVNGTQTGAPITHSTCVGTGCSPGTAPALPVSCGSAGTENTEVIANVLAQITTAFRYCKANAVDTTPPTITNNSLVNTGYAAIIPTSGSPGTSIQVRFGAADGAGIATTSVRLINPSNVVVSTVVGAFLVGSTTSGIYQAYIATASSGPANGDIYQIQAQASDAAGNSSGWFTIGTFTVQLPQAPLVASLGALITPTTIGINYNNQIVLNGFNLGTIDGYSASFNWTVVTKNSSGTVVSSQSANNGNQVYITSLNSGTTYNVYLVATDSSGGAKLSSPLVTTTLNSASTLNPIFSSPTSTASGFTSQITNYDSSYTWGAIISSVNTSAAASINSAGLLTVSGISAGQNASVTVSTNKTGAAQGQGVVSGSSISAPLTTIQLVVSPVDSSGITNIGFCFSNSSAISGTVSTTSTISGPGYSGVQTLITGSFAAYSGMPSCPNMVGGSSGVRLASSSTFIAGVTATANGITYTNSITWTTAAAVVVVPPDTQAPSVVAGSASLSSPSITGQVVSVPSIGNVSDGMSTNSDYTVSINVSDNVGVTSLVFYVDTSSDPARLGTQIPSTIGNAKLISGTVQSGTWSATSHFPSISGLSTFSTSCGRYTVRVIAYDAVGNTTGPIAAREIDIVTCNQ
jgi:hypothetical protein